MFKKALYEKFIKRAELPKNTIFNTYQSVSIPQFTNKHIITQSLNKSLFKPFPTQSPNQTLSNIYLKQEEKQEQPISSSQSFKQELKHNKSIQQMYVVQSEKRVYKKPETKWRIQEMK
ncbi:Hypothetical_protein [Hexamita inflata]|uniref:Hypothetical_protein n=1 Tax=Hexamita inflata TaxID=28002 RepID=A0AA86PUC0_9EUKA|nr:Hypothetical protein HINF_LOCUS34115 [Hexamita inflata]